MEFNGYMVGTVGHMLNSKAISHITDNEKQKLRSIHGCPVNRRIPAKMSRSCFRNMCLTFQSHAGINSNKQNGKNTRMTLRGFKSNNTLVCVGCIIGESVRNNKEYEAPPELTFVDITPPVIPPHPKARKGRVKLTKGEVQHIRKLHQEGVKISRLMELYSKMSRAAISNVVNRITWKNI